jgi:HK97 family phage major capsid protein
MADPVTSSPTSPPTEATNIDVVKVRENELLRIREIQAFGAKFNVSTEAEEFIRSGKSVADFTGYIMREKLPGAGNRPIPTAVDPSLGFSSRDRSTYSLVRALNKQLSAMQGKGRFDGLEAEVSAEMARIHGTEPTGFYVPDWALTRDLTVTPPSTVGPATVQTTIEPSLIPLLRNRTAVLQAGARYISGLVGNVSMPRQNAPATVSWNTEIAALTESDLKMDSVVLSPNRVGGWCNYSKQLLTQSSLDIENIVRDDLVQVIQIAIDAVALNGTGTNQPTGIFNLAANPTATPPYDYTKAAPTVGFGSGYPTWSSVVAFETNVATGNLILDDTAAYITSPAVRGAWKGYAKSDPRNTSIWFPSFFWEADNTVNGHKAIATNQVTGNRVVFGKWNELMIGQWAGLDLVVDIYSLATQAEVRVIANMFVDVKYRYTSAFSYSTNSGVSN